MKFDMGNTHGHVQAYRSQPMTLPPDFTFTFYTRQDVAERKLEFKVIDCHGNTFMKKWYSLGGVDRWKQVVVPKSELEWAWGPGGKATLPQEICSIEFVVTHGVGEGEVSFDQLQLHPEKLSRQDMATSAREAGHYSPRWLVGEQAYWTMAGVPRDDNEALIAEDGTVEPMSRGCSVLPLLVADGKILSRNDATITQLLAENYLPIPSVHWEASGITLDIEMLAHGDVGESVAYVRYRIGNNRSKSASGKLLLLVQPYQVYPPWQGGGGFSPIQDIEIVDGQMKVNHRIFAQLPIAPDDVLAHTVQEGYGIGASLIPLQGRLQNASTASTDTYGFAAATLGYDYHLKPGTVRDIVIAYPLHDVLSSLPSNEDDLLQVYDTRRAEMVEVWQKAVSGFDLLGPDPEFADFVRANIAYNLVTCDGVGLQPGSRSYDKSWMRDGSIAAVALMGFGDHQLAMEFARWFATFQMASGEIPPIIDTKAEDPLWESKEKGLIEYDSQGEFIWLVHEIYARTHDRAFLEEMFPHVNQALRFLFDLRRKNLTEALRNGPPEKQVFYGILPPSTSHEGYDHKHSYWDDFWALRGWADARNLAEAMGREDLLPRMDAERADFLEKILESIEKVGVLHHIQYLPGCAELGDVDPTSSAGALVYNELMDDLPADRRDYTFDYFWPEIQQRFAPGATWRLTPYEFRVVSANVRLGHRDRALQHARFLLDFRRPKEWQHLAEVVVSDYRMGTYIGDMPHTWVGAEGIIAIQHLFAYEKKDQLILGAGIDPTWMQEGKAVGIRGLSTVFGRLDYTLTRKGNDIHVSLEGSASPPGGFILLSPFDRPLQSFDGAKPDDLQLRGAAVRYRGPLPAQFVLHQNPES